MDSRQIISLLPYKEPFLFVDHLESVSEQGCEGAYTFKHDAYFYQGHFKDHPVTPGVILTECMAQIGVVCLGIYLMGQSIDSLTNPQIALTSHQVDFYIPVFPGETVKVRSEKEVFRFNKLKCKVYMYNSKEKLVARGIISGMLSS
ncbi:3-hydroxyacyl-ACP dehydratase FabZ family protein [Winogradskyella aurantiaca]|uniref:3-hydroxyacyl-ACP dehydratase FabZ family protein n=1 Tax=Winogradskyella aurantiaca TaxID=2219558 RepID=UPI000E1DE315|nr:hydroxymyristoyl-ACP dehydratase [Winogradskyella aurantiaca]